MRKTESRTCLRIPTRCLAIPHVEMRARGSVGAVKAMGVTETAADEEAPATVDGIGTDWLGADSTQHRSASL
jgi:hypothetical protein